jgi:hypothetical protein
MKNAKSSPSEEQAKAATPDKNTTDLRAKEAAATEDAAAATETDAADATEIETDNAQATTEDATTDHHATEAATDHAEIETTDAAAATDNAQRVNNSIFRTLCRCIGQTH